MSENYSIRDTPANLESVGVQNHAEVNVSCCNFSVAGWAIAVGTLSILTLDIGWAVAEIACSWTKILDIISCGFALVSLFGALVFWKLNYQKTQPQEGRFIVSLQTMQTMFVLITTGVRYILQYNETNGAVKALFALMFISGVVLIIPVVLMAFLEALEIDIADAGCLSSYLQWLSTTLHSPSRLLRSLTSCIIWFRSLRRQTEDINTVEDGNFDRYMLDPDHYDSDPIPLRWNPWTET